MKIDKLLALMRVHLKHWKMFALAITVVLLFLIITFPRIRKIWQLLKVPVPILPKGLKGDLPDLLQNPLLFGQNMTSIYGSIYRYVVLSSGEILPRSSQMKS